MSEIILHPSDDGVAESKRTEIHVYLFKSREAKTLAQIAKAIQMSEKQIEHHLNVLIGDARKTKLDNRAGRKRGNILEPQTSLEVMLMIFPEQCHEQVDIQQSGHGVRLSIS
jgi:Bacterial regulatory protein, arsR family